jgi:hypothetical protein
MPSDRDLMNLKETREPVERERTLKLQLIGPCTAMDEALNGHAPSHPAGRSLSTPIDRAQSSESLTRRPRCKLIALTERRENSLRSGYPNQTTRYAFNKRA